VKLGIVGGTFDPIHLGHVAMAEAAADCAGLDQVVLLPASVPPHREAAVAPAEDRLAMTRIAVAGHPRLHVSDLELRRAGPSYTVDTLRTLARKRPGDELHLVLGWDAARDIRSWHQPDEVMRLGRLIVVSRPGYPSPTTADLAAAGIDLARAVLCDVRTPDVDATDVRRMARADAGLEGLIHPGVEAYLRSRRLYDA
jgi:nicotinate-nucleotide adenylyltransferase